MTDPTIRERLRELAGWASAAPWHQDAVTGQYVNAGTRTVAYFRYTNGVADAAYVVEAVNALPVLLDELDTLERRAEAAERLNLARLERFIDFTSGKPQYVTANGIPQDIPRRFHKDILDLRAALAKTSGDTRDG